MKKYTILTFILLCTLKFYAQDIITESNYLKQDSVLWTEYEDHQEQLRSFWETMPAKRDSLQKVSDKILKEASEENIRLALKYASVPSGLRRLYMVRLDLSKDTLEKVLNSLSKEMQESFYGKVINKHLQTKQIEKGDSIQAFPCIQDNGEKFDWTITHGKQLLILYGGLGCMGESGREYLKQLHETTSHQDFMILVYWPCASVTELQETKKYFSANYTLISDFKKDDSPIKIKYGTQATPTCFLTDKQHIVLVKCTGIHSELLNQYIPFIQ